MFNLLTHETKEKLSDYQLAYDSELLWSENNDKIK